MVHIVTFCNICSVESNVIVASDVIVVTAAAAASDEAGGLSTVIATNPETFTCVSVQLLAALLRVGQQQLLPQQLLWQQ